MDSVAPLPPPLSAEDSVAPRVDLAGPAGMRGGAVSGVQAFPLLCTLALGLACFVNTIDFNYGYTNGEDHVGLDWQVVVKLIVAAACSGLGAIGVLMSAQVRQSLASVPGCIIVTLAGVLILSSAVALEEAKTVSRVASLVNFGYVMFVPTVLTVLGLRRIVLICLLALVANLMINWVLYLGFPQSGIFEEELLGNHIARRMGGLGHPNSIARTGVLAGVLSLSMLRSADLTPRFPLGRSVLIGIIVVALMTMLATFSRTACVAGLAAAGFLLLDKIFTRNGLVLAGSLIALATITIVATELVTGGGVLGDSLISMTTKTGEVSELTSATGRTAIWAEAVRLISERPLTGYGLNSAPFMMKEFSLHPHNLLLHAMISGGILAGLLTMCLVAWNFFFGLISDEPLVRAISVYVLVSGIFEDTVLDTFASPSTLLWLIVMIYPSIRVLSARMSRRPQPAVPEPRFLPSA
ncbi:O-antigen ligase family protein [Rubripirellula amarantea]|nr:O-antigen ligase family protein [Rubripirellula amarantea]